MINLGRLANARRGNSLSLLCERSLKIKLRGHAGDIYGQSLVSYVTDFLEMGFFASASDWLDSALYIFVRDEYGGPFCKNPNRIRL